MKQLQESESSEEDYLLLDTVGEIHGLYQPPIKVPVQIDGRDVEMELDTGASVSVMSEKLYKQLWPGRSLSTTPIRLQTYSKQPLDVIGSVEATVYYEGKGFPLPLVIVKRDGPTLFGRNWLSVHYVRAPGLEDMLEKYSFKGPDVTISMDSDVTPQFCKAQVIP